jgi:hypothetical protein
MTIGHSTGSGTCQAWYDIDTRSRRDTFRHVFFKLYKECKTQQHSWDGEAWRTCVVFHHFWAMPWAQVSPMASRLAYKLT